MDVVFVAARLLLAGVFALAGVTKLLDRPGSLQSIVGFGVPLVIARPFATVLPLLELLAAMLLIPSSTARWGAIGVLALLALFIVGIAVNLARGRTPDCHCFGQLHSKPVGWNTLVRNVLLAAVAAVVFRQDAGAASLAGAAFDVGGASSLATTVAWVAVAVAAFALYLVFQVLRQNGRLLVRLEAVEQKLGITAEAQPSGLPVDTAAPAFDLRDLDGGTVSLDRLNEENKPLLLVFSEPGCGACDLLLPDVARWQREYADRLSTVVISRGTVGQNRNKRAKVELGRVLLQVNREVAEAYHVVGTPSAVLIEDGRIARTMAVGPDAIRSLVGEVSALRIRKGTTAPGFPLPDLRGGSLDFTKPRGRPTLLLFWSPTCGYCQQMLDELKAWEARAPAGAPDLLVLTTGSAEANREQGFRSPVLLDPELRASELFGVSGTPSAILLDDEGRVASDIAVGRESVMALASRKSRRALH